MPARHLPAPAHSCLPAQRRTTQFCSIQESNEARPDLETCQSQDYKAPIFSSWGPRPWNRGKGDCHGGLNLETWAIANNQNTKDKVGGGGAGKREFLIRWVPPPPVLYLLSSPGAERGKGDSE